MAGLPLQVVSLTTLQIVQLLRDSRINNESL